MKAVVNEVLRTWVMPVAFGAGIALFLAGQALAQQPARQSKPAVTAPAPNSVPAPVEPELPPPVYEKDLIRLAEVMGSLAFLRPLCGVTAENWDRRMQDLLTTEASTNARRERLAGAFNRGYEAFALTYRTCTDSAQVAAARFLREGARLSQSITSRYGG